MDYSKLLVTSLLATVPLTLMCSTTYAHSNHESSSVTNTAKYTSANQMTTTGSALIASLNEKQLAAMVLPFENDALRTKWSNAPIHSKARNGLPIGRLSIDQRFLLHDLLMASTSSQGYYKIWAAIRGDDELKAEGENRLLDSDKFFGKNQSLGAIDYWVSFYGNPKTDKSWSYMITGHHLAANFTVVDGKATFVPMFYGSDPNRISHGAHAGQQYLPQERNRGVELLHTLSSEQKAVAIVAEQYPSNKFGAVDFAGPGKKDTLREKRGIQASALDKEQQKLLWVLIKEYVVNADFDVAEQQLKKIHNDKLEDIYFMWMGPSDGSEKIFYRVQSPSILIDFVDQRTRFDWNTHPHIIVRDPSNDYGQDWLKRHILEDH
jgi:hypothetical protein